RARPLNVVQRAGRRLWKRRRSVAALFGVVVLTTLAIAATFISWSSYTRWRTGRITFTTTGPPLQAQILDEAGEVYLVRTTVPMAEPLSLPSGEYQVIFSAAGHVPEKYRFTVERGEARGLRFNVLLGDRQLWPPIELGPRGVPAFFATANLSGRP